MHIKHKITLRQYKYWILALRAFREAYEQRRAPDADGFHRIPVAAITELFGYEPVRGELKVDLEALRKEAIIYNILGKDGKSVMRGAGFISEWEVAATWIGFKLPSFLEDCVKRLDLKNTMFQQINWSIFNSFSGKYEAIIYKLCKDYVGVGQTPWMSIESYRQYVGLDAHEYKEFRDLNKYTISGPLKRINESKVSDISVTVEFDKKKGATALKFRVTSKHQSGFDFGFDGVSVFSAARVTITSAQQKKYLAKVPPDEIRLAIDRANEYADKKAGEGEAVNLGAIYNKAISDGWGAERAEQGRAEQAKNVVAELATQKQVAAEAEKVKVVEARADERRRALEEFHVRSNEEKQEILSRFKETLKGPPLNAFIKNGLEHPLVKPAFASWLVARESS